MPDPSIIVRTSGGLGNQLFQYAFARALQERSGRPVKLDDQQSQWHARRRWELSHFSTTLETASIAELNDFCVQPAAVWKSSLLDWVGERARQSEGVRAVTRKILKLQTVHPDLHRVNESEQTTEALHQIQPPAYFDGYWQNAEYFREYDSIIRSELQMTTPLSPSAKQFAEQIENLSCPIAIHVRRGDYLSKKVRTMFDVLPPSYYQKAIAQMRAKNENATFVLFSDDIAWVKEKLANPELNFLVVDGDHEGYEDLHLMTLCRHFIIANSTFSWWGAWLGNAEDKNVIAPNQWGLSDAVKEVTQKIIPAEWSTL